MKKGLKIFLITCVSLLVITGIIIPLLPFMFGWNPAYGTPSLDFPFENPNDIIRLAAYNTPDWGEVGLHHTGIDLVIENDSKIISPCYGTVSRISSSINPYKGHIMISIHIVINFGWSVMLVFEPYSNDTDFHEVQLSLINVEVGMKLEPSNEIGTLLNGGEYPHIHFTLNKNTNDVCPYEYSSTTAQAIFDEVAERTNSTICYP